jgi:SAM-dependent methyltransferase
MTPSWRKLPGWSKGFLAQALAWAAVSSILAAPTIQTSLPSDSVWLILIQGALAGLLCQLFGLQRWWFVISLLFLPAIVMAQKFVVPSWVYLWAFILSLLFFWSVIYRGAPLYLSGPKTWVAVAELLPEDHSFRFIDLGSGLGGLAINLSRLYPNGEFHGVELAPGPWLISKLRNWLGGGRVNFFRDDYRKLDLGSFDIVFAFLSPPVMQEIADKAQAEMRHGCLLLSLAFPLQGIKPDFILKTDGDEGHRLYGWRT